MVLVKADPSSTNATGCFFHRDLAMLQRSNETASGEGRASTRTPQPVLWLATGFGLGYSPIASGTTGSLLGIGIVLAVWPSGLAWQIATGILGSLIAIPICSAAERHFGRKDDGRIVADEYLTFPLSMLGLPLTPWVLAMAFVSNRCFDILKPPPARDLQRLSGGLGIVIDDVFAALYSLALNHLLYAIVLRTLLR
jgi:phosphatidylglycerophosphatase A